MPRKDQGNRNESGFYKLKYGESLSKVYGVSLFKSDEEKLKAIAAKQKITPTELIRLAIREWCGMHFESADSQPCEGCERHGLNEHGGGNGF